MFAINAMKGSHLLMIFLMITLHCVSFGDTSIIAGLTAAQKLHGFSGNYGTGGGLGGLTLNDIAYDLNPSFTDATRQVGIKLGLPPPILTTPVIVNPVVLDTPGYVSKGDFVVDQIIEKPLKTIIPFESDVLLTSHTTPLQTNVGFKYNGGLYPEPKAYLTKLKNGYMNMYYSMGHRLSSKLTSDVPFISSKYRLDGPKISGYSSQVIHTSKPYNGLSKFGYGKSSVTFTKLHTGPEFQSIPQLKRTIIEPSVVNSFTSFTPYSYEYPAEYGSAISKRYVSESNGGFGSLLTGSYGSVLNNGYQSTRYFPDGGLSGLKYLYKKK